MHLAQLVYGANLAAEDSFNWYLEPRSCQDFDIRTLRKFEAPLKPRLRAYLSNCTIGPTPTAQGRSVSFPQYAAWCGLDNLVLSDIDLRAQEDLHSPKSSNSLGPRPGSSLLLNLLCIGLLQDFILEVRGGEEPSTRRRRRSPVWVVTWYEVVMMVVVGVQMSYEERQILHHIHEYIIQVGHSISLSLLLTRTWNKGVERESNSSGVLQLLERGSTASRSGHMGRRRSLTVTSKHSVRGRKSTTLSRAVASCVGI